MFRTLIGVRSSHSIEALSGDALHRFELRERAKAVLVVVVLTGVGYGPAVAQLNPGREAPQAAVYARIKQEALGHCFSWVPHEELVGGPPEKLRCLYLDGMRTNEESHQIAAVALARVILQPVRTG